MIKNKNNSSQTSKPSSFESNQAGAKNLFSRILKTNLVYIIGLTKEIANKKVSKLK